MLRSGVRSALRIAKPYPLFGLTNAIGRVAFSTFMLYYLVVWDIPRIVVLFIVPEILWDVSQLGGYWLYGQSQRAQAGEGRRVPCPWPDPASTRTGGIPTAANVAWRMRPLRS